MNSYNKILIIVALITSLYTYPMKRHKPTDYCNQQQSKQTRQKIYTTRIISDEVQDDSNRVINPEQAHASELSEFGMTTLTAPALEEAIAMLIAQEWLERNPFATMNNLKSHYEGTFTFQLLRTAVQLLQQLKREYIFFVNETDKELKIRFGIDPDPAHAVPPRALHESFSSDYDKEPRACVEKSITIPSGQIFRFEWNRSLLGERSYIMITGQRERTWAKFGFMASSAATVEIFPGAIVALNKENRIRYVRS